MADGIAQSGLNIEDNRDYVMMGDESIGEGGELSQKYSHASIVSSIEKIRHGRNLSDCIDINDIEMMEIPSNTLYSE